MSQNYPAAGRLGTIYFSKDGMHLKSEDSSGDYKWSLFHRIVETRRAFPFIVGPQSATLLPRRCFSNSGETHILRQLIRKNFKGKKPLRPDGGSCDTRRGPTQAIHGMPTVVHF
jgi:YcxB-like protein